MYIYWDLLITLYATLCAPETGIELIRLPDPAVLTDSLNSAAEAVLPSASLQRTKKANLQPVSCDVVSQKVSVVPLRWLARRHSPLV